MLSCTRRQEGLTVKDLDEGLDSEGFIVTGVADAKVPVRFRPVLDDLITSNIHVILHNRTH